MNITQQINKIKIKIKQPKNNKATVQKGCESDILLAESTYILAINANQNNVYKSKSHKIGSTTSLTTSLPPAVLTISQPPRGSRGWADSPTKIATKSNQTKTY